MRVLSRNLNSEPEHVFYAEIARFTGSLCVQHAHRKSVKVILELNDVSVIRQGRPTIDRVNFSIKQGEQWAVIGPNGAGKSTLLSLCGTTTLPSLGTIRIFNKQVGRVELTELRNHIGYVTAHHLLKWPMSARQVLLTAFTNTIETPMRWFPSQDQIAIANAQLQKFGLLHVADTNWKGLSQGELGRTFLARAALMKPKLLLLDEPAAGLDLAAREQLLEIIEELAQGSLGYNGKPLTTLTVTHHLEELPPSTTHAALMKHGKIVKQGAVEEILTSNNLSETFEIPIAVEVSHGRWSTRSGRTSL